MTTRLHRNRIVYFRENGAVGSDTLTCTSSANDIQPPFHPLTSESALGKIAG